MRHPWLNELTHESTLADLPTYDLCVGPYTLGSQIAADLERNPEIPGVLICEGDHLLGAISRRFFFYRLSKQFSREVFLHRPIRIFLDAAVPPPLCLDETCRINDAAVQALDRPQDLAYEPMVVRAAGAFHLLDAYSLLRAQAHLLSLAQITMMQTDKLAGLGQLAAGMAHEINNPLAFMSNNLAILQRDARAVSEAVQLYQQADAAIAECRPDLSAQLRELDEQIDLKYTLEHLSDLATRSREGVRRIQQIVADMRDFARMDIGEITDADLNLDVTSTVNTLRGRANDALVTLVLDLQPLPPIPCNPGKISLVVLSLVTNAIESCGSGGVVCVKTGPANGGGVIEVKDTGSGIPEPIRTRIFDPFFTTKPPGQGTGMGLSIAYRIVRDHHGTIDVESQSGQGSSFRVWLPAENAPALPRLNRSLTLATASQARA